MQVAVFLVLFSLFPFSTPLLPSQGWGGLVSIQANPKATCSLLGVQQTTPGTCAIACPAGLWAIIEASVSFQRTTQEVYFCVPKPLLSSVAPAYVYEAVNTKVRVAGAGFYDSQSGIMCKLGNAIVKGHFMSQNLTECEWAPLLAGNYELKLSFNRVDWTDAIVFTVKTTPRIVNLVTSGEYLPATITVTGVHFSTGLLCALSNGSQASLTVIDTHSGTCAVPGTIEGTIDVRIVDLGLIALSRNFTFAYKKRVTILQTYPSFVLSNSKVEVYGKSFDSSMQCAFNGNVAKTVFKFENRLECATSNVPAGTYLLSIRNTAGLDITEQPVSVVVNIASYKLVGTQTSNRDISLSASPGFPTGTVICKVGSNKALQTTIVKSNFVCLTSQVMDIGSMCVELSFNRGFNFSTDCQVLIHKPRKSRTTDISPVIFSLTGGTIQVSGIRFYSESVYECRMTYPNSQLHTFPAVLVSQSKLQCQVPASSIAGTVTLLVYQDGYMALESHSFLFIAYLTLTAIAPSRLMLEGGTLVTISGRDIPSPNTCFFKAASGSQYHTPVLTVSSTQVTCRSPDLSSEGPGTVQISLTEFDGSPSHYLEVPTVLSPTITSFLPAFAFEDLEADIYITGTGFINVPELAARLVISQQLVSVTFVSEVLLKITVRILKVNHFRHNTETVAISINGVDFLSGHPLTLYPSPSLGTLSIMKGPWQGDFFLIIYGNGFEQPGDCIFGSSIGPTVTLSYSQTKCLVPITDPGTYQVSVRVLGYTFSLKPVYFTFINFLEYAFYPRNGPLSGGTVVTFTGTFTWISSTDVVQCSFGGKLSSATFKNGAVRCISPPHAISENVYLHLIVNAFDYSQVGLLSQQFFYEADPVLDVVATFVWTSEGGTLIEISGSGFQWRSNWKCHFGGLMRDLLVLDNVKAACYSPQTLYGITDILKLSANQQYFLPFKEPFAIIEDPSIYACSPTLGPRSGGTEVTLHGNFLTYVILCRFGNLLTVPAVIIDSVSIKCVSPAWAHPAHVSIDITVNGQMYTASKVIFSYYDLPQVSSVTPVLLPAAGGTPLDIAGSGFLNPTLCRINGVVIRSQYVSQEMIRCVTPQAAAGRVPFEISFNGQQYHTFLKTTYTAYSELSISAIAPKYGVVGTIVTITGTGFVDNVYFSCKFGSVEAAWRLVESASVLKCQVPLLPAGVYSAFVSVNDKDFARYDWFTVHWELEAVMAYPQYTSPAGGTEVVLTSLNWPSDVSLARCQFVLVDPSVHTSGYNKDFQDLFIVPATVSGRVVKCSSPPNADWGQSTAKVAVTSEQQTYSASGATLLYYEGSFDGFYRTNSDQVECSPGHFCRREKWYAMSSCEVGFWQPLARQRKCRTCLIGNYCPDRSMTTVVVCPSGKICPARGLANPLMDCPAGYYCLPGTNVTSFWDDSPYYLKPQMCTAPGFFCIVGTSSSSEAISCTGEFYCPAASKRHHGVVPCISGYYCKESVVISCPPRYFCFERANSSPQLCPPGTYNPHPNQSRCLPCSYGYICPHSGMLMPQVCPIGYICNKTGLTNPTEMCTAGYYCDGLVITSYTSRPCRIISDMDALSVSFCGQEVMTKKADPDNISDKMIFFTNKMENMCCWNMSKTGDFISNIGVNTDSPDAFLRLKEEAMSQNITGMDLYRLLESPPVARFLQASRTVTLSPIRLSDADYLVLHLNELLVMKQPQPCPPGMFCLKKTGSGSMAIDQLPPYECNPGTYCKLAASSPQGTGMCPVGFYCPAGTIQPIQTEPGYRAEFQGNVNPAPCMPGFFSNQVVTSVCMSCPSGYECASSGTVWPSVCPPGTYRISGSMSRCIPCPVRSWAFEKGVTSLPFCLPCTAGRLCSQPGIKSVSQTYPCIEGDICNEAADLKSRDGCPAGYLCQMDTSPSEAYYNECIEGFFCKYRTPMRNKYLLQCPTFSYCPPASPDYEIFYVADFSTFTGILPPTICPLGTGRDGKAGKKQLLDCKINDDFTQASTARAYVLEVSPVNATIGTPPTGFIMSDNDTFPIELPYYQMSSFDIALITIDLRHIDIASGLLNYGVDWNIAITITLEDINTRLHAAPIPMPLNFLDKSVSKSAVLEFSVEAWSQLNLTVTILIYNGLMIMQRESLLNTASVEVFTPNRGVYGTTDVFAAFIPAANALPVNMPSKVSTDVPNYLLSFAQSPKRYNEISTPLIEGENLFTPNSLFWQGGDMYMTTYLPYFSNCQGYGAYIPIWALFELRSECNLVAPENTTYVSSFDFGTRPSADSCQNITIECIYDEIPNNQEPLPRWFELPYLSEVFYISESPVSPDNFANGVGGNPVAFTVGNIVAGTGLPRTITLDIKYQQLDTNTKKIITALITFSDYQDITAAQNTGAEIIKYNLIVNFSALTHTELMILFQFPLSFYTVLNLIIGFAMIACCATFLCYHRAFTKALPVPKVKFWGYMVMTIPPLITGMALATVPICIVLLFVSIFVQGNVWTDILQYPDTDAVGKTKMGIFDGISPNYDILDVSDMTMYRNCRVGVSLMLVALYLLAVSSTMFLPYNPRQRSTLYEEDPKGNLLYSVYWRRYSFLFVSLLTTCGCLLLVFFSYSDYFAKNVYPCVAALQAIGWIYEESMEGIIGSGLMKAPIMAAIAVVQGLCTFGAANFVDFLQASFVDYTIMLYNRVYHEDIVRSVSHGIKAAFKQVKNIVKVGAVRDKPRLIQTQISDQLPVDPQPLPLDSNRSAPRPEHPPEVADDMSSLPSVEESDSLSYYTYEEVRESPPPSEHTQEILLEQDVEPLLDGFGGYAADTIGNVYNIIIIMFLWYFYDATQIAATYGIDTNAIPLYFLFAVMMVPFQLIMDTILHNCNEYFNGWAIHDFLDHLNLRFKSRTTRWSVLDTQNVDFVEEDQRTIYLTCFSSQFYFMCTIHCSGMILLLMAIHTLIVNDTYNMFQDRALLAIVPFVLIMCGGVHAGSYYFGNAIHLWRIPNSEKKAASSSSQETGPSFRDLVDTFMTTRQTPRSQVVPVIPNWTQVDLVKAGDEVIRRELNSDRLSDPKVRKMFLAENREWLQHNLEHILTVNNLKKYRGRLLEKFRDMFGDVSEEPSARSYSDMSSVPEVEPMSLSSIRVVRYWVARAQRIQRLRAQTERLVKSKLTDKCQYCESQSALQSELIESIEDLFYRFKNSQKPPFRFQADVWDTGEWLDFVNSHGHFRTLCLQCLALCDQFNADAAKLRKKAWPESLPRRPRAVNFADAPQEVLDEPPLTAIVKKWLGTARQRLQG